MSRSKHTDSKAMRAARRLRAPREGRGVGDLSRRRELGRNQKVAGAEPGERKLEQNAQLRLRIVVRESRPGFHHPADKQDVLEMLKAVGPAAFYGLRSIELTRSPANASIHASVWPILRAGSNHPLRTTIATLAIVRAVERWCGPPSGAGGRGGNPVN